MARRRKDVPALASHGAEALPHVTVDDYNVVLTEGDAHVGDRASGRAFRAILDELRAGLRKNGDDPLGDAPSRELSKKMLDKVLTEGEPEAAGLVHGAVEHFAQQLAAVLGRFLKRKEWKGTERVAIGGGLRDSRVGELAIGRASVILKGEGHAIDLAPIHHHPDEAGLIGAAYLAPSWIFSGHDAILAADIGSSNLRAGIVSLNPKKAADLSAATVAASELWRYREAKPSREEVVAKLVQMLRGLIGKAGKAKLHLAPFIGLACPGVVNADGSLADGTQNLPGNWESSRFNLPVLLKEEIPAIDDNPIAAIMHNDAVVQGLSEVPYMQDIRHWAVLTIGTGLGNARFTNNNQA